jgi:hypothetical protein
MTSAQAEAVLQSARGSAERAVAEWAERKEELRATEWALHLALVKAGQRALERLTSDGGRAIGPTEAARLLDLASKLGRLATGLSTESTEVTGGVPGALQVDIEVALKRVYGEEKRTSNIELPTFNVEG